jgi:4-amino-4-deoxy-L-arabinose transferase-like glycosyltransferase
LVVFLPLPFVYLPCLDCSGVVGPDEPRYASIGREMDESADWMTPVLWGKPWFEKPPLLYWLVALGHSAGLAGEPAARLPVALLSLAFLALLYRHARLWPGGGMAGHATAMLATSAGWLGFSQVAATDLPLAATFGAAMLLSLEWLAGLGAGRLRWAGVCFGLAVLAKGLVPLVLALPLAWFARRRLRAFLVPVLLGLMVAAPWYVAMTVRHGRAFVDEFFLRHHFARFASESLQHQQPWWFYLPVLAAGFLPWTPLLPLPRRALLEGLHARFCAAWLGWGLVFFSLSTNKLPGYLLPLLPALALLAAAALRNARSLRGRLAVVVLALAAAPLVVQVLPQALASGLSRVRLEALPLAHLGLALPVAAVALGLEWTGRRRAALVLVYAVAVCAAGYLKLGALPLVDRAATVRPLWTEVAPLARETCVAEVHRAVRYGLNYYARTPLADCADAPAAWRIVQEPGQPPRLEKAP